MSTKSKNKKKQQISKNIPNDNNFSINNLEVNKSNITLSSLIKQIFSKFVNKYNHMSSRYEADIIDNIIYNEKCHIVSVFKDLLIVHDYSDYLKRYYTYKESMIRLPKYFEYYNLYSKIFPNYTSLLEGKYLYINIQRKQRMIDLQEKMENYNSKNENNNKKNEQVKRDINVFNTSVVNSILNRTNKEEMELLFNINLDNIKKNENIFIENVNKIIDLINSYEIKEDYLIDYDYVSKTNKNKNNNKENISPLMNININYINFNKINEDKTNYISINNHPNKNNIFLYKIFNISMKDGKSNNKIKKELKKNKFTSIEKKDYSLFVMKINQLKNNKNLLNNMSNYIKDKYLSIHKNNHRNNSFVDNKSISSKKQSKNRTIVYDNKNKSLNNLLNININNRKIKNLFSYKSSFNIIFPNNNNNNNNLDYSQKLYIKSPLSQRNKSRNNNIDINTNNLCLTNNKYLNNNNNNNKINYMKENNKNENNFYKLMNNSRNKISLHNNIKSTINKNNSQNYNIIQNSLNPSSNSKFKIKQKKKIRQNSSFLNKTVFKKNILKNNMEIINNKTTFRDKILFNNFMNENINNKNISLLANKNYSESIKSHRLHHSYSTKKIDSKNIINKKNKSVYISKFLRAFNNSIKSNIKYPYTQREYQK